MSLPHIATPWLSCEALLEPMVRQPWPMQRTLYDAKERGVAKVLQEGKISVKTAPVTCAQLATGRMNSVMSSVDTHTVVDYVPVPPECGLRMSLIRVPENCEYGAEYGVNHSTVNSRHPIFGRVRKLEYDINMQELRKFLDIILGAVALKAGGMGCYRPANKFEVSAGTRNVAFEKHPARYPSTRKVEELPSFEISYRRIIPLWARRPTDYAFFLSAMRLAFNCYIFPKWRESFHKHIDLAADSGFLARASLVHFTEDTERELDELLNRIYNVTDTDLVREIPASFAFSKFNRKINDHYFKCSRELGVAVRKNAWSLYKKAGFFTGIESDPDYKPGLLERTRISLGRHRLDWNGLARNRVVKL